MKTESLSKPHFADNARNQVGPEFAKTSRNNNRFGFRNTLSEITETKEPKIRNLIIKSDSVDLVSVNMPSTKRNTPALADTLKLPSTT